MSRADFQDIDQNIATNIREYREARHLSQDELAQQMTVRGFGFSQATIWKIETGKRPVKVSEAAAFADALGLPGWSYLTAEPKASRHSARLQAYNRRAADAYEALKDAAEAYLTAQLDLLFVAREAHDAGVTVLELWTSWLDIPPERAVIETRYEEAQEDKAAEQTNQAVNQVMQALQDHGYEPKLPRAEDLEIEGDGQLPVWKPR